MDSDLNLLGPDLTTEEKRQEYMLRHEFAEIVAIVDKFDIYHSRIAARLEKCETAQLSEGDRAANYSALRETFADIHAEIAAARRALGGDGIVSKLGFFGGFFLGVCACIGVTVLAYFSAV